MKGNTSTYTQEASIMQQENHLYDNFNSEVGSDPRSEKMEV